MRTWPEAYHENTIGGLNHCEHSPKTYALDTLRHIVPNFFDIVDQMDAARVCMEVDQMDTAGVAWKLTSELLSTAYKAVALTHSAWAVAENE